MDIDAILLELNKLHSKYFSDYVSARLSNDNEGLISSDACLHLINYLLDLIEKNRFL